MLLKNGHLHMLDQVATGLTRLATKGPDLQIAVVTTALELDDADQEAFRSKLAAKYGSQLEVDFKVDANILGGVIVQVGDQIIDGSVANQLGAVRESLARS